MENLTECQIEIKKIREATGMNRRSSASILTYHTGRLPNGSVEPVMHRIMF